MDFAQTVHAVLAYVKERLDSGAWSGKWDPAEGIQIYLSRQHLFPATTCPEPREECARHDNHLRLRAGTLPTEPHQDGSRVVFVDLVPPAGFAHSCVYIYFDEPTDGTKMPPREFAAQWFPQRWHEQFQHIGMRRGTADTEPLLQLPIEI